MKRGGMKMKTGIIIYITGGGGTQEGFDIQQAVSKLDIKADRVETVFGRSADFDVVDAWWRLTTKGMQKIVCMLAEVTDNLELRLTGRELRLCG